MKSLFTNLFRRYLGKTHAPRKPAPRSARLTLEQLDQRILLTVTASVSASTLAILSTTSDSTNVIVTQTGGPSGNVIVSNDGQQIGTYPVQGVTSIKFDGSSSTHNTFQNMTSINAMIVGGQGADLLYGGDGSDTLVGGGGNDTLKGGNGNDTYRFNAGDAGKVTISELSGNDTLDFSRVKANLNVNLAATGYQKVLADGSLQVQLLDKIENLIGGSGNDRLAGGTADGYIAGGPGDDTYVFNKGDTGMFSISDGSGTNTLDFSAFSAGVTVNLGTSALQKIVADGSLQLALHGTFQNVFGGSGNDSLTAGKTAAFLSGGPGNDTLIGSPGNDKLVGGGGNDVLRGGPGNSPHAGNDTYVFSNTDTGNVTLVPYADNSTLDFSNVQKNVTIDLAANGNQNVFGDGSLNLLLFGNVHNVLGGSGNDNITGGSANGILNGGPGNDTLTGGSGNEVLMGAAGNDSLNGGPGMDIFFFDLGQNCGSDAVTLNKQPGSQAAFQFQKSASELLLDSSIVGTAQVLSPNLTLTLKNGGIFKNAGEPTDYLDLSNIEDTKLRNVFRGAYVASNEQLTRDDALQLFQQIESEGAANKNLVLQQDVKDLKIILLKSQFIMPDDVRVLMNKVVNHDVANSLVGGDLSLNSSVGNLQALVNKWFLGMDNPESKYTYAVANSQAPLFQLATNAPAYTDVVQGSTSDCYLLAALAEVAYQQPSLIESMITDNKDGTYTVRYFVQSDHHLVPDYVTVDTAFPVDGHNNFAFANYGMSINGTAPLWVALAEKAYAELNEEGVLGSNRTPGSYYGGIAIGDPGLALQQITGQVLVNHNVQKNPAPPFSNGSTSPFDNWTSVTNTSFVTLGSFKNNPTDKKSVRPDGTSYVADPNGIIPDHAYAVVGTTSDGKYILYNPWGTTIELKQQDIDNSFALAEWITANPKQN